MKYVVTGVATVMVKTIVDAADEAEAELLANLECEELTWTVAGETQLEEIHHAKRTD
jgi:hypothetical protein